MARRDYPLLGQLHLQSPRLCSLSRHEHWQRAPNSLVEATKAEAELNALANQRSYSLTSRQIDLQSKSNVYVDTLQYFYNDFLVIQEMATALGLPFDPKAYG